VCLRLAGLEKTKPTPGAGLVPQDDWAEKNKPELGVAGFEKTNHL
jgi:hypothetical protein